MHRIIHGKTDDDHHRNTLDDAELVAASNKNTHDDGSDGRQDESSNHREPKVSCHEQQASECESDRDADSLFGDEHELVLSGHPLPHISNLFENEIGVLRMETKHKIK